MSEPAFPGGNPSRYDGRIADGLSKREWFAGQMLAGIGSFDTANITDEGLLAMAGQIYRIADAMLAASKEPTP
jgi:hypothetical protein